MRIQLCKTGSIGATIDAWRAAPLKVYGILLWKIVPYALILLLWKERDERFFNGISRASVDNPQS